MLLKAAIDKLMKKAATRLMQSITAGVVKPAKQCQGAALIEKAAGLLSAIRGASPQAAGLSRQTQLYYEHLRRLQARRVARLIAEEKASKLAQPPANVPQIAPAAFAQRPAVPPNPMPRVEDIA